MSMAEGWLIATTSGAHRPNLARGAISLDHEQQAIVTQTEAKIYESPVRSISHDLAKKPRRQAVACNFCRHRRIKCSGTSPCGGCISREHKCTFERPTKRLHPWPLQQNHAFTLSSPQHNSYGSDNYEMGMKTPQSGELAGANAISGTYGLSGDKEAVSFEPRSTALSTTAPKTLKYDASQPPTAEVSRNLPFAVSKWDEDKLDGPFCIQEGYGEPITGGDEVSIHYALFEPSICEPYFSTYNMATLDAFAQPEYDSRLWMLKDVLGKKLGERFWCRAHSGINCLVEIVSVNGIRSEVLDSSTSRRSGTN